MPTSCRPLCYPLSQHYSALLPLTSNYRAPDKVPLTQALFLLQRQPRASCASLSSWLGHADAVLLGLPHFALWCEFPGLVLRTGNTIICALALMLHTARKGLPRSGRTLCKGVDLLCWELSQVSEAADACRWCCHLLVAPQQVVRRSRDLEHPRRLVRRACSQPVLDYGQQQSPWWHQRAEMQPGAGVAADTVCGGSEGSNFSCQGHYGLTSGCKAGVYACKSCGADSWH